MPDSPPTPLTLEYRHAAHTKRAVGGLRLLGGFTLLLGLLPLIPYLVMGGLSDILDHRHLQQLILLLLLPTAGLAKILLSWPISHQHRPSAIIALLFVSSETLLLAVLFIAAIIETFSSDHASVCLLFLLPLVLLGWLATAYEIIQSIRTQPQD